MVQTGNAGVRRGNRVPAETAAGDAEAGRGRQNRINASLSLALSKKQGRKSLSVFMPVSAQTPGIAFPGRSGFRSLPLPASRIPSRRRTAPSCRRWRPERSRSRWWWTRRVQFRWHPDGGDG